jgi:hypothetical protein
MYEQQLVADLATFHPLTDWMQRLLELAEQASLT